MARIEPFRGVRPRQDLASLVAAPPYDVLSSEEARELAAGQSLFVPPRRQARDRPAARDRPLRRRRLRQGQGELRPLPRRRDHRARTRREIFYVYKQIWGEHVQVGLVAGRLLPGLPRRRHQEARADPRSTRRTTGCATSRPWAPRPARSS
ncbi:MAG: DUF1015 family protein [Anaerotruncus sp.]|nr:DUF1015 family protein [Anaerotruncus sp.]